MEDNKTETSGALRTKVDPWKVVRVKVIAQICQAGIGDEIWDQILASEAAALRTIDVLEKTFMPIRHRMRKVMEKVTQMKKRYVHRRTYWLDAWVDEVGPSFREQVLGTDVVATEAFMYGLHDALLEEIRRHPQKAADVLKKEFPQKPT